MKCCSSNIDASVIMKPEQTRKQPTSTRQDTLELIFKDMVDFSHYTLISTESSLYSWASQNNLWY